MAKVRIRASTRRTKSGKVVQIRAHDQNRDTVGESLKAEGRTPTASQPGNFPNGRSTPTTPAVAKYEASRQDAEIRAAQIRARMAEQQLAQVESQQQGLQEDSVHTPGETVAMYSIADQFDAMIKAVQEGKDLPEDDASFDEIAPQLLSSVQPLADKNGDKKK